MNQQARYRFGPFEFDVARHSLEADGTERALKPRPFELLCYLLDNRDRTVTRDELFERVWPGVFVSDNTLSRCVADLRKALDDASDEPRYIRTIPRVGYRFISSVEIVDADRPGASQRSGRSSRRKALVAAVILVVLLVVSMLRDPSISPPTETGPIAQSHKLLPDFQGNAWSASFAPDGEQFVFVGMTFDAGEPEQALFRSSVGEGGARRIPATRGGSNPRWSPDGRRIMFEMLDGTWLLEGDAGARLILPGATNARWSGDGRHVVFERDYEVWLASDGGGQQRKLAGPAASDLLLFGRTPSLSHDGSQVAFVQPLSMDRYELQVQFIGHDAPRTTIPVPVGTTRPVWSADDTELFFEMPVSGAGHRDLYRVPVDGGEPRPLLSGASGNTDLALAGERIIYTHSVQQSELVIFHAGTSNEQVLKRSFRGIGSPRFDGEGKRIAAFVAAPFELVVFDAISGDQELLTSGGRSGFMPQWSGDGLRLFYYRLTPDKAFVQIDLANRTDTTLVTDWQWGKQNGANVDATGQRIIYSVLDRGLPTATLIRDIETGQESVFHTLLKWPQWSLDGRRVLGTRFTGDPRPDPAGNGDITICEIQSPHCRSISQGRMIRWSRDEPAVYFTRLVEGRLELWTHPGTENGKAARLHQDLATEVYNDFFDVGPEGQVVWVRGHPFSSLWLSRIP